MRRWQTLKQHYVDVSCLLETELFSEFEVLQTVQMPGVCSAVYDTVHYKDPLKSFYKRKAFCRDIAMIVQKATWSNIHSLTHLPGTQQTRHVEPTLGQRLAFAG